MYVYIVLLCISVFRLLIIMFLASEGKGVARLLGIKMEKVNIYRERERKRKRESQKKKGEEKRREEG